VAVTAKTLRLIARIRASLLSVTDSQTRELVAAWATAWDAVSGDLELAIARLIIDADEGTVTRAQALRATRLQSALGVISGQLTRLVSDAEARMIGDLPGVVRAAGEAQAEIIASQLPRSERARPAAWDLDDPQLKAIVQRTTERITSQLWPISAEADAVIRRELVRGIAAGSNPRQTAARMIQRAEGGFNGGLSRALVISRTETLDAHRAAAKAAHEAHAEVLAGWVWVTALSPRTCPACLGMAGTEHPLSEPGPQGHQQCKCSRGPLVKSWRDLGIDLPEPASALPDAQEWFGRQPVKVQQDILGPARYKAWRGGKYPIDRWAVKKPNADWRPSYQVSPLPKGGRSDLLAS